MAVSFQAWLAEANPTEVIKKLESTQVWVRKSVILIGLLTAGTTIISLLLNQTEWRGLNLVFPFALIIIALYHAMEPFKFLFWFGGGTVYYQGLPNNQLSEMLKLKFADFKADELVKAGIKGVNVWWEVLVLMWLAAFLWFMMMATIPVSLRFAPGAILVLMAALLATFKWPSATHWFKLICSAGIGLFGLIYIGGALFSETKIGQRVGETTESAYTGLAGKTHQFNQVIASKMTVEVSNFKDYNGNGVVDDGERRPVQLPEGCYRIQIGGPSGAPSVLFSNNPNQPTALTGALRMGTDGDMGHRNEESFWVPKGSKVLIGFDTPDRNVKLVDEDGQPSWNFTPVSLTESTDCQKPE